MSIILVGGFSETIELCRQLSFIIDGIIDGKNNPVLNASIKYLGNDSVILEKWFKNQYSESEFFLTPDQPRVRKKLFVYYSEQHYKLVNLVSNDCRISKSASIATSTSSMIQSGVNISSNVVVGNCVRVNSMANIMHDCVIGDFVTIAPNAVLLGGVIVENDVYIGANSTILPGIKIGKRAVIGAGAVVTKNVSAGDVVVGSPARKLIK
jgi:sugar O-acyltransferase (sialic acid O-acetyltransferase NeuD family)